MNAVLIGLLALLPASSPGLLQDHPAIAHAPPPAPASGGVCEVRPDAPYVNPRLPLGRAAYANRPACRTTWAPGPHGPGLYVQGAPMQVEAPPVNVGGLRIYLVPPEIVVRPSEVTVEPPQVQAAPAVTEDSAASPAD